MKVALSEELAIAMPSPVASLMVVRPDTVKRCRRDAGGGAEIDAPGGARGGDRIERDVERAALVDVDRRARFEPTPIADVGDRQVADRAAAVRDADCGGVVHADVEALKRVVLRELDALVAGAGHDDGRRLAGRAGLDVMLPPG